MNTIEISLTKFYIFRLTKWSIKSFSLAKNNFHPGSILESGFFIGLPIVFPKKNTTITFIFMRPDILIPRRDILKAGLAITGAGILSHEHEVSAEQHRETFDIYGLHDAPIPGGSRNVPQLFDDIDILGANRLFSIDPSRIILEKAREKNISLDIRLILLYNRFSEQGIVNTLRKIPNGVNTAVQPFNEVNLAHETGYRILDPQTHALDILKAHEVIKRANAKTIITPLAQNAPTENGIEEMEYYKQMLSYIAESVPPSYIREHFALGIHTYVENTGDNIMDRVSQLYLQAQQLLGTHIPVYITETGIHEYSDILNNPNETAEETIKLLRLPLPKGIPIEAVYPWVYANDAQRPRDQREQFHNFEQQAWRKTQGPSQTFEQVAQYAKIKHEQELRGAGIIYP